MKKRLEEVSDFFYSKVVNYELAGCNTNINMIETNLGDVIDVSIKYSTIQKLRLNLYEKLESEDHELNITIFIDNVFGFDGIKMRKELLSIGLKKYKKSKENVWGIGLCHIYSIKFDNVTDLENIFKLFKYYLPK